MSEVSSRVFALACVLLACGQMVLTSQWFGAPAERWARLTDGQPIVSGRHPLHLYHAMLGAETFAARWSTSCYDPAFQAGYPKTPVFDGGSRPAELVLYLSRPFTQLAPATAYKLGLVLLSLLVPLAFVLAAWGIQLRLSGMVAAGMLGCVVWWAGPVQAMQAAGAVDILLAGLAGLVYVGGLARYSADPRPLSWAVAAVAGMVGWYAQPVVWLALVSIGLGHYLVAAPRHGFMWHLGRAGITIAGILPNLWWLTHWFTFWWLRTPSIDDFTCLPSANTLFGDLNDYPALLGWSVGGWTITVLGIPGAAVLARSGKAAPALGLCAAATTAVLLAKYTQASPTFQILHGERAVWFAVALLTLPAAGLLSSWATQTKSEVGLMLFAAALPLVFSFTGTLQPRPLTLGLSGEQSEIVRALQSHTTTEARILWEDGDPTRQGWNWSALLPSLTDRHYIGGLDSMACIDHSFAGMRFGRLNGKQFSEWTVTAREEFIRRYNIGWVVTRTATAATWWATEPTAHEVARFTDQGDTVILFRLERKLSFFLKGSGTIERMDRTKIVLKDVHSDENGECVLSLHYQAGLRLAPLFLHAAQDKDANDPVPMLKLILPGDTTRIILAWEP